MALYAFDGTFNRDKPGSERDSNVVWFRDAYREPVFYLKGIGTRFGALGKVVGGITGAGGRSRVRKARKALIENFERGDTTIDIVGFSRGAALALHFANKIKRRGVETKSGKVFPEIRFLGLWDTVPSFGAPSVPANVGWNLGVPDNVRNCYHALSLDERRHTFKPKRLSKKSAPDRHGDRLEEVWFRGVHSDVGGGNRNPGLSSIALDWMFAKAKKCGLPIDPQVIADNRARMKPDNGISIHEYDKIKQRFRRIRPTDCCHESVRFRGDTPKREHNNPPAGLSVVDNAARRLGGFRPA